MTEPVQVPPHDREAERALVGAVLQSSAVLAEPEIQQVQLTWFYDRRLRKVWAAVQELQERDVGIDILTISDNLSGAGDLDEIGGSAYLTGLIADCPGSWNAAEYARIVGSKAEARRLLYANSRIAQLALSANGDSPDMFAEARRLLEDAEEGSARRQDDEWSAAELAALEIPEDPYLVDGLVIEFGLNLVAGNSGSGKTFLCLDLALAAASGGGRAWERDIPAGNVLMLCADSMRNTLVRRVRQLSAGRGIDPPGFPALQLWLDPLDLSQPAGISRLRAKIRERKSNILILDTANRYMGGLKENDAGDVALLMARLRGLSLETGITMVLVHHLTKNETGSPEHRIRGSGDWYAAMDSVIMVKRRGKEPNLSRKIVHLKNREGRDAPSMKFTILSDNPQSPIELAFERTSSKVAAETKSEVAAEIMADTLRREPNRRFSSFELFEVVADTGIELSERMKTKVRSILAEEIPGIAVVKIGRTKYFQFEDEE